MCLSVLRLPLCLRVLRLPLCLRVLEVHRISVMLMLEHIPRMCVCAVHFFVGSLGSKYPHDAFGSHILDTSHVRNQTVSGIVKFPYIRGGVVQLVYHTSLYVLLSLIKSSIIHCICVLHLESLCRIDFPPNYLDNC